MADGAKLATGWLELVVSTSGAQKQITDEVAPAAARAGDAGGKTLGRSMVGAAAAFAGPLAAAAGIGAIIKTGFDEVKDAAAGTAQLAAGIASTGNAANVSVQGLNDLASSIQRTTGQTDDSIVAAQSLLLTFTNIKNQGPDKIFDQATQAAADMAARMGGDASSNALLLGKALNDPVKGITALTRVGVSFTQQQKDQIAAMAQAGDTLGAQKIILGELNKEFGGSAAAFGKTLPGQIEIMKRSFEDLAQTIVGNLVPVLQPMIAGIATALQQAGPGIEKFGTIFGQTIAAVGQVAAPILQAVGQALGQLGSFVVSDVLPALQSFGQFFQQNSGVILGFAAAIGGAVLAFKAYEVAQTAIRIATAAWAVIQGILNGVMIANPLGLVITLIGALVGAIVWVATQTTFFQDAWAAVSSFLVSMWTNVASFFTTVWNGIVAVFQGAINGIVAFVTAWVSVYIGIWTGAWNLVASVFRNVWNGIVSFFGGIGSFFAGIWNGLISGVSGFVGQFIGFFTSLPSKILAVFAGAGKWLLDVGKNLIQGLLDGAGSLLKNIGNFFLSIIPGWIVGPFKAALGIHSPSRVFADLGTQTMAGYMLGVNGQQTAVNSTLASLVSIPRAGTLADGLAAAGLVSSSGMPSRVTLVDEDGSILAHTRMEIDRANRTTTTGISTGRQALEF